MPGSIGYRRMLLDTLPGSGGMPSASTGSWAFTIFPCYNDSLVESTLSFQLDL